MDLFEDETSAGNAPEFTVSELSGAVKRTVEEAFGHVRVRGEIGRISRPASGHLYLDLKDDRAVLAGVIWKGTARKLSFDLDAGLEVVATGRLTTFPGSSRYQIVIESISPAGAGALMAMLEKRKAALAAEGLFDAERKRPIPYLPDVVGVVTSPSGAVIRDILHRLQDRFPRDVLLWPVAVQGEKCAEQVAQAIWGFNELPESGYPRRPDVLIVARGGGSLEDLWGFNEEVVARAAAASRIPLISAVGHETDTTLIDFAADVRAPTPTAAAEMAVPVRVDLLAMVAGFERRRRAAAARSLSQRGQRLRDIARGLPRPEALVSERAQRLDGMSMRLPLALTALTRKKRLAMIEGRAGRFGPSLLLLLFERKQRALERTATRVNLNVLRSQFRNFRERLTASGQRLVPAYARLVSDKRGGLEARVRVLESLGYDSVLKRGFAVVRDAAGKVVTKAETARQSSQLEIQFSDARMKVRTSSRKSPAKTSEKQGTLL